MFIGELVVIPFKSVPEPSVIVCATAFDVKIRQYVISSNNFGLIIVFIVVSVGFRGSLKLSIKTVTSV